MGPYRLFVTGEWTNVTFSPAPMRIVVSISLSHHPRPFWIFRTLRTNPPPLPSVPPPSPLPPDDEEERACCDGALEKKDQKWDTGRTKREILVVQKNWNEACREKEKSDRDKGMNADGEIRLTRQKNKDYNDENTDLKLLLFLKK